MKIIFEATISVICQLLTNISHDIEQYKDSYSILPYLLATGGNIKCIGFLHRWGFPMFLQVFSGGPKQPQEETEHHTPHD